ncbi:MAG: class I SAM-dependent methyltransferase [Desulfonatronovibrio sp.]
MGAYCQQSIELELRGRKWLISRAGNLDELWEEMTGEAADAEDHIPYWTEVWPASKALSGHISDSARLLAGRLCLDIGCGLGLTSLVARSVGARVVAMDFEKPALEFARQNALINNIPSTCWVQTDWRNPGFGPEVFDFIWAADVLYEARFWEPLAGLLRYCLKDNGRIWIADPERNVSVKAWDYFETKGFTIKEIGRQKTVVGSHSATVRMMELSK